MKGKQKYLERAVDADGNTLEFLLRAKRDAPAAKRFGWKALQVIQPLSARVITVDNNAAYPQAIDELKAAKELPQKV